MHQNWEVMASRRIYRADPWIDLGVETVRLPDGRVVEDFHQLVLPDFVLVFTETREGKVIALNQYKHGPRRVSLSLPGGLVEKGEDPALAARRELLEETGYEGPDWSHLGSYWANANLGCGQGHFYLARGCRKVQEPKSGDLEDMEILLMERDDLKAAMTDGRIVLSNQVSAISLALAAG